MEIILYPVLFFVFWYKDGFKRVVHFFSELNKYCVELLSLPLLLRTFFKPIKNEYRGDLVLFSIGMGIAFKSFFIVISTVMLVALIIVEVFCLGVYLILPLLPVYLVL